MLMRSIGVWISAIVLMNALAAQADTYNLKVVTDASPDYSDLHSLVYSATSRWSSDAEKTWAMYYWNHIARRQTNPVILHGMALTDPIRQFNDYGYTMCSTISGINCMIWQQMGYPAKYYDIANHTVPEVFYDGRWHMYDNSLSCIYTLCDGHTIAGVEDIGKTLGCAASGGKEEPGHIAKYHAVNGTSPHGFLEGGDTIRDLAHLGNDTFNPKVLKHRFYYFDGERGHRYILNLRDGETYTRYYHRLDAPGSDPAYFIANGKTKEGQPKDPEAANPRYRIRGNGVHVYEPKIEQPGQDQEFKVEGANVITSLRITGQAAGLAVSTTNGRSWREIPLPPAGSDLDVKLQAEVSGAYEVLVQAKAVQKIKLETVTEVNSKTLPKLNVGRNTVSVGAGEQTGSIVLWPELQSDRYQPWAVEAVNVKTDAEHQGWHGVLRNADKGEGYVVFEIAAPADLTRVTQSARMYVRQPKAEVRFEHSLDGGKTWITSYRYNDTQPPWDKIHDEVLTNIPPGTKSVLVKYVLKDASLYSLRIEGNHRVPATPPGPLEVTYTWSERQADYSLVKRSHTQLVEKLPATYTINVGGADHPVVESLAIHHGRTPNAKYGYDDGRDAGGEKWVGQWVTYGKNLAEGKTYTLSAPSQTNWGAGDPDLKKLTDGRVGSSYSGGASFQEGALWGKGTNAQITVDLVAPQTFQACRIHIHGYPAQDAIKGAVQDQAEVLVSDDGQNFRPAGKFDFNLRWQDLPVNYMWTDEETFNAHNHLLRLSQPVTARYVKFALKPSRLMDVTEVQVLDDAPTKPFDLKIALPAGK